MRLAILGKLLAGGPVKEGQTLDFRTSPKKWVLFLPLCRLIDLNWQTSLFFGFANGCGGRSFVGFDFTSGKEWSRYFGNGVFQIDHKKCFLMNTNDRSAAT
jgi:hypothetical protein